MKKINNSPPLFTIQCYEDRQPTPIRKADLIPVQFVNDKVNRPQENQGAAQKPPPPPPPPMPLSNGHQNDEHRQIDSHHSKLVDKNLDIPTRKVATLSRIPTPDYNNKTDLTVHLKPKNVKDNAEIQSMESYKLKNPVNVTLKPPSNYFIKAPNGSATMKKHTRPVSVTIGEYVNNIGRKEPSKLDFLNGDKVDSHRITEDEPITSRLQSELALTLSRSNLRKKTESLANLSTQNPLVLKMNANDENFHARYGNNLLPLPPSISIPKVSVFKAMDVDNSNEE